MIIASKGKSLSVFTLVMMNVIAVDSLRNLTMGAEYGLALVFFYLLAAILFFIPTVLVSAELATGWPATGGAYVWVREAFGPRIGFLSIWLQWIYNVVWYPTIFAFIAGIVAYLIAPQWVDSKLYMLGFILISFWLVTWLSCTGIKTASIVSTLGAIFGTLVPMLCITALGTYWLYTGHPSQFEFSFKGLLPGKTDLNNLAFVTNILFGLMGMEMSAVHAGDVRNPGRDYPRALFISMLIILVSLVMASLAIAVVLPPNQLNLVSGLMDAFEIFFRQLHLGFCIPIFAGLIILGSLSGAAAWIIGPARGLLVASSESQLPVFFQKLNAKAMPTNILLVQGLIVTLLSLLFLLMPSVKSVYWLLSNLTAQLALLFYILFFAAAIRLHHKKRAHKRAFKIPGGTFGLWLVAGTGMVTCLLAILIGFLPPTRIAVGGVIAYELLLIAGILLCCLPPFLFHTRFGRNFHA